MYYVFIQLYFLYASLVAYDFAGVVQFLLSVFVVVVTLGFSGSPHVGSDKNESVTGKPSVSQMVAFSREGTLPIGDEFHHRRKWVLHPSVMIGKVIKLVWVGSFLRYATIIVRLKFPKMTA